MGTFQAPVEDHLILPARVRLIEGDEQPRRRAGRRVPTPVPLRMLIDTGANRTTLIPGIVRQLEPSAGRDIHLNTPSGSVATTLYWVRLDFPETRLAAFENIQIASLEMPAALREFHGLLGRDVLRCWDSFLYEGRRGRYVVRDIPSLFGWLRRWL